jgi:multiple sugar transport system substrate-binding protein
MYTKVFRRLLIVFMILLLVGALPLAAQDDEVQELGTGETEINFWSGLGGPDGESMTGLIQAFTEENPDVKINYQILGWGTFFDKLSAAIVAGSGGPDLMTLWHSVVPQYALTGHIMPVAEQMFNLGMLDKDDFSPALLNSVTFDGEVYPVPFDNYGSGLYVNTHLLERAGISVDDPPEDGEEFLDYVRRLTWDEDGNNPGDEGFDGDNIAVWPLSIGWNRVTVTPALYQWDTDVITAPPDVEVLIDSDASKAAVQYFHDLVFEHHVLPGVNWSGELMLNDGLSMYLDGAWVYNFYNSNMEDGQIAFWPYPRLGPERGSTIMWSHTLAVSSNIEQATLDATMRLIQFLSDNSKEHSINTGMPSARLSLRTEDLADQIWTFGTLTTQMAAEGVPEYQSERFTEVENIMAAAYSSIFTGQQTVEEGLDDAGERIRRALR